MGIIFNKVSFGYNEIFLKDITCHFDKGWTAVVGANGAGKTTILKLISNKLQASEGVITKQENIVYCAQRTDNLPEFFEDLLDSYTAIACKIKGKLQVEYDWLYRWGTLSHGERKRAQIATALFLEPKVLVIDEPTNHLDQTAKKILTNALKMFNGVGVIVSHDRILLNELPYQCLFVEPPCAIMRKGTYEEAKKQQKLEEDYAREEKRLVQKKVKQLHAEAIKKRDLASRAHQTRSKKGIAQKDHDAKSKIDLARVSGKDGVYGKLLNQMQGRINQQEDKLRSIKTKKVHNVNYNLNTIKSKSKFLFKIEDVELIMGKKLLIVDSLSMRPGEKIAVTGDNGTGKSTLIKHIVEQQIDKNILYIPQEITKEKSKKIIAKVRSLSNEEKGKIITIVGSLGSDPKRVLYTEEPTPGEIRKLMLALGILKEPVLIIMDEPTNHMDLPSAICLEKTLKKVDSGLLLVSHDSEFLLSIVEKEWRLKINEEEPLHFFIEKVIL